VLHAHDRLGRRTDLVEFHPSYHALMAAALRHGLHGTPWSGAPLAHVERAAGFMLFTEAEPSVLCPVSMTYAVTPALRANAALQAEFGAKLAARDYDERFVPARTKQAVTMGMGMTEKQGGSDVRANTTRAEFDGADAWGRRYAVTGHKWFMSAPMCDAFLILAQAAGGLSCFFLPRFTPDGRVNAISVMRLKHKLGNHANASSEVEFDRASAWLVGEEGRGVPQILAMGALTRLDCALGTAGLMRQALTIALHHTAQRHAFGKPLIAQPLMKNVLADLALESEAATLLALRLALAVDRTESGSDDHEAVMRRVLTPIAKFWICKRGSHFGQEAMECLGGNGYVEEAGQGVMARIYREMPLNSIWEGAGNIMALDLLRALRGTDVAPALEHELGAARGAHPVLDRAAARVLARIDAAVPEAEARLLARDTALVLQAALLHRVSPAPVFEAFCAARLAASSDVFGVLGGSVDLDPLIERAMPVEH
jgi:putative acyl-CoA dehydrogenase